MATLPERLQETLDLVAMVPDRADRIQLLIDVADRFRGVPEGVAGRPYPEAAKVPACESEAYAFTTQRPDGTLDFHFAVENPQGVSAQALAVILSEGLSGAPLDQVVRVPREVVYDLFGRELSMGKSMGLMGMVAMVQAAARRRLPSS
jgi:cysteine desulfuration protein SufE